MTCGPEPTKFRVLAAHTEWKLDLRPESSIAIGDVIELALLDSQAIDPNELVTLIPPPWIAHGCGPCEWFIASPARCGCPRLLRYAPRIPVECESPRADPCLPAPEPDRSCLGWIAIAGVGCQVELIDPVAVAATGDRVAVLDRGRRELLVLSLDGRRVIASIPTNATGPIGISRTLIAVADGARLTVYNAFTLERSHGLAAADGTITGIAVVGSDVWFTTSVGGATHLHVLDKHGHVRRATLEELRATRLATSITAAGPESVCLAIPTGSSGSRRVCIDRCGEPAAPPPPVPSPSREKTGAVVLFEGSANTNDVSPRPLDSGIPRCRWHRVRIDAEIPERTAVAIELATVEQTVAANQIPPSDWQRIDDASLHDFLVAQPPGRYLHLRLQLRGDGIATPSVRSIRIDFPRSTSVTRLPGVFREDPIALDFLERFVSLFDASIEDLDRVIASFPALLDPTSTPAEALGWLGSFLDIALDPAWSVAVRRDVLAEAPELYRRRGTPWALSRAVELVTGVAPAITELGGPGTFGRLARPDQRTGFRIGEARLFGRARARLRLGSSTVGLAPLRSYGDPDRDHVAQLGWRISVQVPHGVSEERVRRLVDAQKPAHVAARVRSGSALALLGVASAVGIDTHLGGLPLPRLGQNTRLSRDSALARGASRGRARLAVGTAAGIEVQTVLM